MVKPERDLHRHIRVRTKYFKFEWQLDGFDQIPFVSKRPIYSPCFSLGTPAAAVWQLLILKDIQELNLTREQPATTSKESLLKTELGEEVSSISEEKVLTNGVAKETEEKNKVKEKKADIHTKEPEDTLQLTEVSIAETGTTETNIAIQTELIAVREGQKKSKIVETKEKVLGFRLMKTAEGSIWEIVDYDVTARAGDSSAVAMSLKKDDSKGEKVSPYKYLSKTNLGEWDLFQEKTITVEVLIECKCIDVDPLYPLEIEGNCMTEDCCYLLKNPKYADIILKAGNAEIPAHRGILCVRAFHFDVYLQELQESEQSKIKLDLDESVAEAMIKFIYCGGFPVDFPLEKCPALHSAAEKYKVSNLKATCSDFFKRYLDPEVCLECLNVSSAEQDNLVERASELGEERLRNILSKEGCSHAKTVSVGKVLEIGNQLFGVSVYSE